MGFFDNAESVFIEGKEVESIIVNSNNAVLYQRADPVITLTGVDNSSLSTCNLEATLTLRGVPLVGRTVYFLANGVQVGYGVTNANGVASYSYNYSGVSGNVNMTASYSSFLSETYVISNMLLYETCETWNSNYIQSTNIMYSDGTQYIQPSTGRDYMCTFIDVGSRDFRYTLKTTGTLGLEFSSTAPGWDYFFQLEAGCFLLSWENGYTRLASCSQPSSSTQILTKQNGVLHWQVYNQNILVLDYTCSATTNYSSACRYLGVANATGGASSIQSILVEAL